MWQKSWFIIYLVDFLLGEYKKIKQTKWFIRTSLNIIKFIERLFLITTPSRYERIILYFYNVKESMGIFLYVFLYQRNDLSAINSIKKLGGKTYNISSQ